MIQNLPFKPCNSPDEKHSWQVASYSSRGNPQTNNYPTVTEVVSYFCPDCQQTQKYTA